MAEEIIAILLARGNYWAAVVLMMIGLWGVIAKENLVKKIIGLVIFQTSILLFYVSIGVKYDATIPILEERHIHHEHAANETHAPTENHSYEASSGNEVTINEDFVAHYANPLPHVLMLTAIVVGVGTLGVALSIVEKIFEEFGTVEEPLILEKMSK